MLHRKTSEQLSYICAIYNCFSFFHKQKLIITLTSFIEMRSELMFCKYLQKPWPLFYGFG